MTLFEMALFRRLIRASGEAMAKLERHLQRSVERILKATGICYRKRHGSGMGVAGDPDIYFLYKSIHVEIELKRPGEEPTPLQQLRLKEWGQAGAWVRVVHSTGDLRELLAQLEAATTKH